MSASDWYIGQTVRQMPTDEVIDLVQGQNATIAELRYELDQQRIRAAAAEADMETLRAQLAAAEAELQQVRDEFADAVGYEAGMLAS